MKEMMDTWWRERQKKKKSWRGIDYRAKGRGKRESKVVEMGAEKGVAKAKRNPEKGRKSEAMAKAAR